MIIDLTELNLLTTSRGQVHLYSSSTAFPSTVNLWSSQVDHFSKWFRTIVSGSYVAMANLRLFLVLTPWKCLRQIVYLCWMLSTSKHL